MRPFQLSRPIKHPTTESGCYHVRRYIFKAGDVDRIADHIVGARKLRPQWLPLFSIKQGSKLFLPDLVTRIRQFHEVENPPTGIGITELYNSPTGLQYIASGNKVAAMIIRYRGESHKFHDDFQGVAGQPKAWTIVHGLNKMLIFNVQGIAFNNDLLLFREGHKRKFKLLSATACDWDGRTSIVLCSNPYRNSWSPVPSHPMTMKKVFGENTGTTKRTNRPFYLNPWDSNVNKWESYSAGDFL